MLRRLPRVIDPQQSPLIDTTQQRLHPAHYPLGPRRVEVLTKPRILAAQGKDQAAQLDGLVAADQSLEATGNVQQHVFHRRAFGILEHQRPLPKVIHHVASCIVTRPAGRRRAAAHRLRPGGRAAHRAASGAGGSTTTGWRLRRQLPRRGAGALRT
ncbi:hypothetical protein WR25_05110 [Diploscapter pachys]|uniref:Uncharacterized protein n=1 Tax=Diploscapter pachys TaxID=2018661 RepID=A0A2A2K3J5_9BILA|nr:hypothetical protein WR25_05110 [Diploscapter pachys]